MTGADRFASTAGSYWSEVLPRLEHFVRVSNMGPRHFYPPLRFHHAAERQALVSETGFRLWALSHEAGETDIDAAQSVAMQRVSGISPSDSPLAPLDQDEARTAHAI